MAKIAIKSEKMTPFGGLFPIMEHFTSQLGDVIDGTLGRRCKSHGYQYSEIIRSLMCVYFCGGSCIEDVTSHLQPHLSLHPVLRTCSSDTVLRAIKELTTENVAYNSEKGKSYNVNTAELLNKLLVNSLISTKALSPNEPYDVDFGHQFIETEKYDAVPTYKRFRGYRVAAAVIGDKIALVENADGNTNVRFRQADTLRRFFTRIEEAGIRVDRFRADCGSCSKDIVSEVERHCRRFYNVPTSADRSMIPSSLFESGIRKKLMGLISSLIRYLSRNGTAKHTGSSSSVRGASMENSTCGRANTPTAAS